MQRKFSVLRVVGTIYKILGWIVLVIGLLGACGSIALGAVPGLMGAGGGAGRDALGLGIGGVFGGVVAGLILIFMALLYFLFLYAFGDMIYLLLALEENTRMTAERLAQPIPPATTEPPGPIIR